MEIKNCRVVVMGAGHEAAEFLRQLHDHVSIVAFCADAMNLASALEALELCKAYQIPIIDHYKAVDAYSPNYIFMVSYPPLIDDVYLAKYRFINMHSALLPRYRGFHGGVWAVINGERLHGFTLHLADSGIDSGPIYFQMETELNVDEDINALHKKLTTLYDENIKAVFLKIIRGELAPKPQDETEAIYVCRRRPSDGLIDWNSPAWNVFNLVRALAPPYTEGAFTLWQEKRLFITKAIWTEMLPYISTPGQVVARLRGQGILVKCSDRPLLISELTFDEKVHSAENFFKTVGARLG